MGEGGGGQIEAVELWMPEQEQHVYGKRLWRRGGGRGRRRVGLDAEGRFAMVLFCTSCAIGRKT